eukprot:15436551-Alexandrium_andersonii.AAC.1
MPVRYNAAQSAQPPPTLHERSRGRQDRLSNKCLGSTKDKTCLSPKSNTLTRAQAQAQVHANRHAHPQAPAYAQAHKRAGAGAHNHKQLSKHTPRRNTNA